MSAHCLLIPASLSYRWPLLSYLCPLRPISPSSLSYLWPLSPVPPSPSSCRPSLVTSSRPLSLVRSYHRSRLSLTGPKKDGLAVNKYCVLQRDISARPAVQIDHGEGLDSQTTRCGLAAARTGPQGRDRERQGLAGAIGIGLRVIIERIAFGPKPSASARCSPQRWSLDVTRCYDQ